MVESEANIANRDRDSVQPEESTPPERVDIPGRLRSVRMHEPGHGTGVVRWEDVALGRGVRVNSAGEVEVLAEIFNRGENVHQLL